MEQHYPFTLPPLPYGYDALAPELIEKVLYFHHDKHFAAYVDALNQLLERTPAYQSWPALEAVPKLGGTAGWPATGRSEQRRRRL